MKMINKDNILLFLYMITLAMFNFTIGYIIPSILLVVITIGLCIKNKKLYINRYILIQLLFLAFNTIYLLIGRSVSNEKTISSIVTVTFNLVISISILNYILLHKGDNKIEDIIENIVKWLIPISIITAVFILLYTKGTGVDGRLGNGVLKPFSSEQEYLSTEIALIAFYGFMSVLYFFSKTKKKKYLLVIPLLLLIIILSGSRKSFIIMALTILLYYYDFNNDKFTVKKIVRTFIIISAIILLCFAVLKIPFLYDHIGWRFIGIINKDESSYFTRNIMYNVAIEKIKIKPWLGYGLNTFSTFDGSFGAWSHNNYLEILVAGGILLFSIYYSLYIYLLIRLYRKRKSHKIYKFFLYTLLIIMVCDFIGVTYMDRYVQLFLLLGSILAVKEEKNDTILEE